MAENNNEVAKVAINDIGTEEDFIKAVDSTIKNFGDGDLVEGTVVKVDHDEVLLDIGYKTEGVIPSRELSIKKDVDPDEVVEVGDTIEALVVTKEDKEGRLILSKKRAQYERAWGDIEKIKEADGVVEGTVIEAVKGGLIVDIGLRGFLPASLVEMRRVRDLSPYIGQTIKAKILELDKNRNNVVLSRRQYLEETQSEVRETFLSQLKKGQIREGVVSSIVNFGAFVDLGGVDGLIHVSELSWKHIDHPSEVVKVGDKVTVEVLDVDLDRERISLSLKATQEDPWQRFARTHVPGQIVKGKVTKIVQFGVFISVEDGIEGLVHVSEMDWTNKNVDPRKVVQLGDEVEVMVLDIDEDRRRISLGMKQCKPNPWDEFAQSHKKGDRVKGQIKSITDFGVFIGLPGGIDGLVHLSDLSWNESGEEAVRQYKKGDEVEAMVLAIDTDRERISLGIKQLGGDPFGTFASTHEKGAVVKGTVKSVDAKGAVIDLGNDVEGYLRASEISTDRVEDATTVLSVGQEVEAAVISLDRKNRSIQLSIKAKDAAEARVALDRVNADAGSATGTTNLGALLKAKLEQK